MDIFEYLPQLIVAYDGNDEFANLIHVKKADKDNDYYCPCCGGIVKPRAIESTKEQSHYYHLTGKCTKESQLHFFCKNWLFESGSKFYVDDKLFEVESIEVEKSWTTPFGDYRPDITVFTTTGEVIYFEIFFSNRKTGDDYFCKWNYLKNDVVEVNIKEFMYKTDTDIITRFKYLYHDGICYSKSYLKKDLYANTIGRIKRNITRQELINYKIRIEQLDKFWQCIINNQSREIILDRLSDMCYEDLLSCYDIIKRKQCVSYLKDDVRNFINQKVIAMVKQSVDIPDDKDIYFDFNRIKGRTYEIGIRLNLKLYHGVHNEFFSDKHVYKDSTYPKVVFSKNIFNPKEINIPEKAIDKLTKLYRRVNQYKEQIWKYDDELSEFENHFQCKVRIDTYKHTVIQKKNNKMFEVLFKNQEFKYNIDELNHRISYFNKINSYQSFVDLILNNNSYIDVFRELQGDFGFDCKLYVDNDYYNNPYICFSLSSKRRIIYESKIQPTITDLNEKISECKNAIEEITEDVNVLLSYVGKINMCKNNFWKAEFSFDEDPKITIDQNIFIPRNHHSTSSSVEFYGNYSNSQIEDKLLYAMMRVMDNMEYCGYRVMEERADEK